MKIVLGDLHGPIGLQVAQDILAKPDFDHGITEVWVRNHRGFVQVMKQGVNVIGNPKDSLPGGVHVVHAHRGIALYAYRIQQGLKKAGEDPKSDGS